MVSGGKGLLGQIGLPKVMPRGKRERAAEAGDHVGVTELLVPRRTLAPRRRSG